MERTLAHQESRRLKTDIVNIVRVNQHWPDTEY